MHVLVNGVRLFFDVEGAKLVPEGSAMRERPTLILLHGGPGFDHTVYKPAYSALADIAQPQGGRGPLGRHAGMPLKRRSGMPLPRYTSLPACPCTGAIRLPTPQPRSDP